MPQNNAKRIILEVSPKIHGFVKEEAQILNIPIRQFCLRILLPEVFKRRKIRGEK